MYAQSTTHKTLLDRVAAGSDPGAWPEFCARYEELIRRFALRRGVMGPDGDDVVQDVLMALTKALPGFEYDPAKGKFRSYLKTVVIRTILKKSREKFGQVGLENLEEATRAAADDADLDELWEQEWRQQHLRRAMKTVEVEFNANDLACFQAYVVNGEDAADVAARLGYSTAQVYQCKYRMMERLREVIAAQVEDEG